MSDTLYEYYNTGGDAGFSCYDDHWIFQTFTPDSKHKITSIILKLYRMGNPGTFTVSIRATSASKPTGDDLFTAGTTDGDTLTTDSAGEEREISLPSGIEIDASTMYAIVMRATDANSPNKVRVRYDETASTYSGGDIGYSLDSGSSWTIMESNDCMFEEYGIPSYQDIGIRYYDGSAVKKIGVQTLSASHKLRVYKTDTVYGIPLVAPDAPEASKIRIWDGSAVKALPEVD